MYYIGIDIGSTAAKVVVLGDAEKKLVLPTGWSSKETAAAIKQSLLADGIDVENKEQTRVIATGYGRVAVEYADKVITEITCHARGGRELGGGDCTIIDVGGQDTKVIQVRGGMVDDFLMNDKCSAGTGKFLEVMANRLGITIDEMFALAAKGKIAPISSLCTVFAESEVISYVGEGREREDIAAGIVDSVAGKVAQLVSRQQLADTVVLTGGLSHSQFFADALSKKLNTHVTGVQDGKYAGALGAALLAQK